MHSLAGLDREACDALVQELDEAPYRAAQLFGWTQQKMAASYDAMSNLPKAFRAKLAERIPVRSSHVAARHPSDDGTVKLLVELHDGETVECVLIPEADRRTACISTQVGCGVGCTFCASGADGVVRNLDAGEIIEQVFWLTEEAGDRLTNIVVMGMGEPLHNVAALVTALRILQHPEGVDLGSRRITVSTSGPKQGFADFLASGVKVKLALSLHAAFNDLRSKLVPRGGSGTVAEIRRMASDWFEKTGRDVTYEYVLLDGINDSDRDADALAKLCGRHTNVNLIPMNPVPFAPALRAPPVERTERFAARLEREGIHVHLRRQRGDDVAAACGQLRLSKQDS
ncbi:MAG: dual-specificity RNA methyltransferase RlmN [Planctomycetota bacterium]|jgi:23S rRNA (adenine2503-C2)-methyltransferase